MKTKTIAISTTLLTLLLNASLALAVDIANPAPTYFVNLAGGNTFANLFLYIINVVLQVVGILSVGFIIWGGFQYIASRGDEEMAANGKKTVTNAIIGLAIIIFSYIIVVVINNALVRGNA
jgi:hypothetical protein